MSSVRRIGPLLLACALLAAGCSPEPPSSVVLIVIDTLRADRLSCYGYARATTPRLDALAARGIRFERAASTSSWTLPAHASLFTGLFPIEHGATQEHTRLEVGPATLAELLRERGYATFAASGNSVVNVPSGLTRGFEVFVETWRRAGGVPPAPLEHPNLLALREFLAALEPERPFFAFLNYIEPHGPYTPPEPYKSRFLSPLAVPSQVLAASELDAPAYYLDRSSVSPAELAILGDLYDGEVAYADALVGALVDELESGGRLGNALLVITSDHGENLGDHGHLRHVFSLYNTTVRVPLILLPPGGARAGEVRPEPVDLIDVFATIAARAGVRAPGRGRDLLGPASRLGELPLFAEYYFPLQALSLFDRETRSRHRGALAPYLRRLRSVEWRGLRLIWSSDGRSELYDLDADPHERIDRFHAPELAARRQGLEVLLEAFVTDAGGPRPLPAEAEQLAPPIGAFGEVDAQTAEQLRRLGYLR